MTTYGAKAISEIGAQGWKLTEHVEEDARHAARFVYRRHALTIEWVKTDGRWRVPTLTLDGEEISAKSEKVLRAQVATEALKALSAPAKASTKVTPERVSEADEDALTRAPGDAA
jgi:hypothetical protein